MPSQTLSLCFLVATLVVWPKALAGFIGASPDSRQQTPSVAANDAVIWSFVAGTIWWYLLSRAAQALLNRFLRRDTPSA